MLLLGTSSAQVRVTLSVKAKESVAEGGISGLSWMRDASFRQLWSSGPACPPGTLSVSAAWVWCASPLHPVILSLSSVFPSVKNGEINNAQLNIQLRTMPGTQRAFYKWLLLFLFLLDIVIE